MPWFFNTISGELANEAGVAALPYEIGPSWHSLKIPATDTFTQAAADAKKEFPNSPPATGGLAPGLGQVPAGAVAAATGASYSGIANAASGFITGIESGNFWLRIGEGLLGILLIAVSLAKLSGADNVISKAIPK